MKVLCTCLAQAAELRNLQQEGLLGLAVQAYNPSTWEVEGEGSGVQGQLGLYVSQNIG